MTDRPQTPEGGETLDVIEVAARALAKAVDPDDMQPDMEAYRREAEAVLDAVGLMPDRTPAPEAVEAHALSDLLAATPRVEAHEGTVRDELSDPLAALHTWAIDNGPTITTEALLSEITRLSTPHGGDDR